MPASTHDQASQEPQTVSQAEAMIIELKQQIGDIQSQLEDSQRRSSMDQADYRIWQFSARKAQRHKRAAIRSLSLWLREGRPLQGRITTDIQVASTLKFAARQYGKLIRVFAAAKAYVDSTSDEDDEKTFGELLSAVEDARKFIAISGSDGPASTEGADEE